MKRIVLTITILLASAATAMADPYNRTRPWTMGGQEDYYRNRGRSYSPRGYGSYGYGYSHYGYYGNDRSLTDTIFGWTDERKLRMAEKEQDFRHEQERATTEQMEREQMFARALKEKQAKQEQKCSENERLRQEVEKLELELKKARLEKELKMLQPNDPNE
jgi:opacity protein-like surface antigen